MNLVFLDYANDEYQELDHEVKLKFDILFGLFKQDRLPSDSFKKLESRKDMYEFRVKVNTNIYRALVGYIKPNYIVVLIFQKKTQKTPRKILEKAEKRFKTYRNSIRY